MGILPMTTGKTAAVPARLVHCRRQPQEAGPLAYCQTRSCAAAEAQGPPVASRPGQQSCPGHPGMTSVPAHDLPPAPHHSPLPPPGVAQTTCSSGRRQPQEAEARASFWAGRYGQWIEFEREARRLLFSAKPVLRAGPTFFILDFTKEGERAQAIGGQAFLPVAADGASRQTGMSAPPCNMRPRAGTGIRACRCRRSVSADRNVCPTVENVCPTVQHAPSCWDRHSCLSLQTLRPGRQECLPHRATCLPHRGDSGTGIFCLRQKQPVPGAWCAQETFSLRVNSSPSSPSTWGEASQKSLRSRYSWTTAGWPGWPPFSARIMMFLEVASGETNSMTLVR